jgi:hypothetical protein
MIPSQMDYEQNKFTLEVTSCSYAVAIYKQRMGKVDFPFEDYGWPADTQCSDPLEAAENAFAGLRLISKVLNYKVFLEGKSD